MEQTNKIKTFCSKIFNGSDSSIITYTYTKYPTDSSKKIHRKGENFLGPLLK